MLTGRNPWHVASLEDRGFAEFLRSGANFIRKALPVSRNASRLLTRTLDPDPDVRYTLSELRMAIQTIDTFFLKSDSPDAPQPRPISVPQLPLVDPSMEEVILTTLTPNSVSPATVVRPESITDILVTPFVNETPDSSPFDALGGLCVPSLSGHSGSSRSESPIDSRGPPTPVSIAHNPAIARVSDLALSSQESSQESTPVSKHRNSFSKQVLTLTSSGSKLVQRFVDVVQRVKIRT